MRRRRWADTPMIGELGRGFLTFLLAIRTNFLIHFKFLIRDLTMGYLLGTLLVSRLPLVAYHGKTSVKGM